MPLLYTVAFLCRRYQSQMLTGFIARKFVNAKLKMKGENSCPCQTKTFTFLLVFF